MLVVVVLVAAAPLVAGLAGAVSAGSGGTNATNVAAGTAVDVVIVFDRSKSTNEDRYHMAQEVDRLPSRFDDAGIDARYGLVTYNATNRIAQPLTSDYDSFERAMHFQEGGNVENASDAILTATNMNFRDDAKTVVVLVTDEDDDGSNASRDAALSSLSGFNFVIVSPSSPSESSCAVHSPPCDNRSNNELRSMGNQVGGDWINQNKPAADIVDGIADVVESTVDSSTGGSSTGGSSNPTAEFQTTDRSVNRTTAEVGDLIRFNKTVENVGTADGTYNAYFSHDGVIVAERTVSVPSGESRTITFVHRFEDPGEYEVLITHERVATVTVTEPRNESIDLAPRSNGTGLSATVADVWTNGNVRIAVTDAGLVPADVAAIQNVVISVGDVNVTPAHDVAFDLEVLANQTPPNGTEPLPEYVTPRRYLAVDSSLGTDLVGLQFEYEPAANETTPYVYKGTNATWIPLNRTAVNANETLWRTNSTAGSLYAIGVRQPEMSVTRVGLVDESVTVGESTTVAVTVRNKGAAAGTYNADLWLNGSLVGVERIALPVDENRTVEFTVAPDRPGRYTLSVPEGPSTTLQVDAAPTPTATPTATPTPTVTPTTIQPATESPIPTQTSTSTRAPGFGLVVALVALTLAGALLAYRRR